MKILLSVVLCLLLTGCATSNYQNTQPNPFAGLVGAALQGYSNSITQKQQYVPPAPYFLPQSGGSKNYVVSSGGQSQVVTVREQ